MKLSDEAVKKLLELKESWDNVKILQKEYYHDPIKTYRRDLENAYAVLTTDVEFFLKKCHIDES
jgi:hypothetical protein